MSKSGLVAAKLIFMSGVFIMAFVSGILPSAVPWCKKRTKILGIANAFSAGVFLAIAFLHIMPEASEGYTEYLESNEEEHEEHEEDEEESGGHNHSGEFPLPFAMVFLGYALILLVDKVVFDTHSLVGQHAHGHFHDPVEKRLVDSAKKSIKDSQRKVGDENRMTVCQKNQ